MASGQMNGTSESELELKLVLKYWPQLQPSVHFNYSKREM